MRLHVYVWVLVHSLPGHAFAPITISCVLGVLILIPKPSSIVDLLSICGVKVLSPFSCLDLIIQYSHRKAWAKKSEEGVRERDVHMLDAGWARELLAQITPIETPDYASRTSYPSPLCFTPFGWLFISSMAFRLCLFSPFLILISLFSLLVSSFPPLSSSPLRQCL